MSQPEEPAKTVANTKVELAELMLPEHANPAGNVHGGTIMKMIDNACLIAAQKHTRANCVTASVDKIDFHSPVFVGNLVTVKASVNLVAKTSMEVGAHVEAECMSTGRKTHVGTAYSTFVALDENDKPMLVADLILETELDRKRNHGAQIRREKRLRDRKTEKAEKREPHTCLSRPR